MSHNNCEGCPPIEFLGCGYSEYNEDDSCPCGKCIVKMMCDAELCDDFVKWTRVCYKKEGKRPCEKCLHYSICDGSCNSFIAYWEGGGVATNKNEGERQ